MLKQGVQLGAQLFELCGCKHHLLCVQVEGPTAPGDGVGELSFLPAHGRVDAGKQDDDKAGLLVHVLFKEQCEQIIHIDPCAVRAV